MGKLEQERRIRWWVLALRMKIIMRIEDLYQEHCNFYSNASRGKDKMGSISSFAAPFCRSITSKSSIYWIKTTQTFSSDKTQEREFMYRVSLKRLSVKAKMLCKSYTKDLSQDTLDLPFIMRPVPVLIQFSQWKYNQNILKMEWVIPKAGSSILLILLVLKEQNRVLDKG